MTRSVLPLIPTEKIDQNEGNFNSRALIALQHEANTISLASLLLNKAISESDEPSKPFWNEDDQSLFNDCMVQLHANRVEDPTHKSD